jgi:uncharacterized membrane protein YbhN (UPF0104 family)
VAQRQPQPRARRALLLLLQLLLTALVTVFIARRVGLGADDLIALDLASWRPRWAWLALSCAVLLLGYLASAAIWRGMVVDLGGPELPLGAASQTFLVANLGRYLPGKVWQIAGLAVLALQQGVPVAVSTAAAVLGQALALGGAALIGAGAFWARGVALGPWNLLLLGSAVLLVSFVLVPPLQRWALRLWFKLAGHTELSPGASGATMLKWLLLYALNWAVYGGAFWIFVRSYDLPGAPILLASSFAAAYVLGYAMIFAPAGIGVREGFLVLFLSPAMGAAPAAAVSVLARVWTTAVEVIPAGALWALHVGRTAAGREGESASVDGTGRDRRPMPPGAP